MSVPRKHHYLTQFYLEGFRIDSQQGKHSHIWQIEKAGDQAYYSPAIRDTGSIRDFHTLDFENEDPDHRKFESLLSKVESEQAELIRDIRKQKRIDSSQTLPLAEFISLLRYRVPACAAHIEKMLQSIVLDFVQDDVSHREILRTSSGTQRGVRAKRRRRDPSGKDFELEDP